MNQVLSFSGVGAHHQNGIAERAIQTVTNMARACMFHAQLHWPERSFIDLWPLAMTYAIWVYNKMPHNGAGLSPEELFLGIKSHGSQQLQQCHVFGCPVYVLDPALQDGKKIPRWDSRARQGMFVGCSREHSTTVPLVLNPRTSHVSPQFHVIFDDAFSTVPSLNSVEERDKRSEQLFSSSRELFLDPTDVEAGVELLEDQWLAHEELSARMELRREQEAARVPAIASTMPVPTASAAIPPRANLPQDRPVSAQLTTPKSSAPPSPVSPFSSTSTIPDGVRLPPAFLRSGGTGFASPIARTGPIRHSGERILDVDTNI
jgi:hypothetical protein